MLTGDNMKDLPVEFLDEMKELLTSGEYERYLDSFGGEYFRGIRINTLKCTPEKVRALLPFETKPSPFCKDGFYIPFDTVGLGALALHKAGAFYAQEPSAMSAVTLLDVQKGDKVLDLCAAPGGKSTQIAADLGGTGLLWSNEIVKSRANILLSNIERMGIPNAVVSSCRPDRLCGSMENFFDKVLVDAPCSGEGMFRKDETAIAEWSTEHSRACSDRQLAILESAAKALAPGGVLVYSTCTFSKIENENVIERFLEAHGDFVLEDCGVEFGRRAMDKAVRIFPDDGGEGHFAARLRRNGGLAQPDEPRGKRTEKRRSPSAKEKSLPEITAALKLYDEIMIGRPFGERFNLVGDKVLLLPEVSLPGLSGLGVIRAGVLFGTVKKNRIEPEHALFMAAKKEALRSCIDLPADDERLEKFFRGEEINTEDGLKGFTAVLCEGITAGFGKAVNGVLKNRYPKGLRSV